MSGSISFVNDFLKYSDCKESIYDIPFLEESDCEEEGRIEESSQLAGRVSLLPDLLFDRERSFDHSPQFDFISNQLVDSFPKEWRMSESSRESHVFGFNYSPQVQRDFEDSPVKSMVDFTPRPDVMESDYVKEEELLSKPQLDRQNGVLYDTATEIKPFNLPYQFDSKDSSFEPSVVVKSACNVKAISDPILRRGSGSLKRDREVMAPVANKRIKREIVNEEGRITWEGQLKEIKGFSAFELLFDEFDLSKVAFSDLYKEYEYEYLLTICCARAALEKDSCLSYRCRKKALSKYIQRNVESFSLTYDLTRKLTCRMISRYIFLFNKKAKSVSELLDKVIVKEKKLGDSVESFFGKKGLLNAGKILNPTFRRLIKRHLFCKN